MGYRQWSDEDKAEALAALDANGGNVSATARQCGVPRVTLIEWRDGRVSEKVSEIRQEKKGDLADRLEAVAHQLIDCIPAKQDEANLRDVVTSIGIAVDKMRLLREQSTSIHEQRDMVILRAELLNDYLKLGCDEQTAREMVERAFSDEPSPAGI